MRFANAVLLPRCPHASLRVLGLVVALIGCRTQSFPPNASAQPAVGAPDRFDPMTPQGRLPPADTLVGAGCLSPMSDLRDGTVLTMERAMGGVADYSLPTGRYGVQPGQLLRLDCNTGRVIGVVPQ